MHPKHWELESKTEMTETAADKFVRCWRTVVELVSVLQQHLKNLHVMLSKGRNLVSGSAGGLAQCIPFFATAV